MSTLSAGSKIDKYVIQNLIKENLYTETYKAKDEDNNTYFLKLFVIKRMPEKLMNFETKMVKEVEYARNIKHKNVVSFIDDGRIDTEEGECQYYLTNYFSGEILSEKIRKEGSIAETEAIEIYKCILEGLQYMHNQELFHNDITPRNIMLSALTDGVPEIIDMGHVSSKCAGKVPFDTSDLELFYSANETFAGMYDEQSDIFSATAVLYTMLFGECPWKTNIPEELKRSRKSILLKEYRKDNPIDFDILNVSDKVKNVLAKGLSLTYEGRYKNVNEILYALDADDVPQKQSPKKEEPRRKGSNSKPEYGGKSESPNKVDFEVKRGGGGGFNDIAGMDELKTYLNQRVIFVIKNKEKIEKYKLTPPNGLLLYGPPGCDKTFVAEKFAEETGFNFILVKSSDLASSFVHGSQEKIAQLFKQAEQQAPTVICFDEFDALVPDRSLNATQYVSGEVNEFLSQLNNCSERGIFVVGTTNRPDKIDVAVRRTGRMDKIVYVPLPDKEARKGMFSIHLQGRPYSEDIDFDKLAELSEGYIASDIAYVVNDSAMIAAFTDREITQQLLEETISNTRPSLHKDTLEFYETMRGVMENTERANMVARPKIGYIH